MKAKIKYLKTGKEVEEKIVEVFYTDGRIGLVREDGFSVYYPADSVEITIAPE